ncbi:unnamed protein product [Prorocentrum cordatum]|uniref:Uncharacterized protein n=1 Tax=Prorocentrum cordatum TaxID=2364126 RepID=A0ABN9S470_9DINO|nr:unnamed protein product [Polarella glacialis]
MTCARWCSFDCGYSSSFAGARMVLVCTAGLPWCPAGTQRLRRMVTTRCTQEGGGGGGGGEEEEEEEEGEIELLGARYGCKRQCAATWPAEGRRRRGTARARAGGTTGGLGMRQRSAVTASDAALARLWCRRRRATFASGAQRRACGNMKRKGGGGEGKEKMGMRGGGSGHPAAGGPSHAKGAQGRKYPTRARLLTE